MTDKIFPKVDPSEIEYDSERLLYEAFRNQLSDEYVVFHSYPWLRPDRDLTLREGEADFIILHQKWGMLIVEAKGGQIDFQAPYWKRKVGKSWVAIKDPFEQAKRNMHNLNDLIEKACEGDLRKSDYVYGFCAAFPTHNYMGRVPHNSAPAIIIAKSDMESIQTKIEEAFRSWSGSKPELTNRQFQKLVSSLLPKFKLFRPITINLQEDLKQIKELTQGQIQFFQMVKSDRVFVTGVAGSGKTLLAMDRAKEFAQSKRTLLVCFNKELALWWREQFFGDQEQESGPVNNDESGGELSIYWFHSLASRVARSQSIDFEVPTGYEERNTFYQEEAARLIEQAAMMIDENDKFRFDAVVLDEAQDFHPTWWDSINYCLLKKDDSGTFYAFGDSNQSLWSWSMEKPDIPFSTDLHLDQNCRNTKSISLTSSRLRDIDVRHLKRSPLGLKPQISRPPSRESSKGIVTKSVEELLNTHEINPNEIALIGPRNFSNGSLSTVSEIAGIPLTNSAAKWRNKEGILVTTSRAFKGLEADAIVLYDVGELNDFFSKTDLYVACTRARTYLHVITHDSATEKVVEEAIEHGWDTAERADA